MQDQLKQQQQSSQQGITDNVGGQSAQAQGGSGIQKSKRRTKNESTSDRNYTCGCGKAYLSYPALYLHLKNKHNGKTPEGTQLPNSNNKGTRGRPKKDDVVEKGKDDAKDNEDEAMEELINFLTSLNKNLTLTLENRRQLHIKEVYSEVLEAFPKYLFKSETEYMNILTKLEKLFEQQELEAKQMEEQMQQEQDNDDQLLQDQNMNDNLDQLSNSNKKTQPDMQLEEQQQNQQQQQQKSEEQENKIYEVQIDLNKVISVNANEEQKNQQNLSEKVDKHIDNLMEIKDVNCNQIFAIFLQKIAKCITNECFKEIAYFICLYRNALNQIGWNYLEKIKPQDSEKIKLSIEQKDEFCEKNSGEFSLEICNEFIIDYLPLQLEVCGQLRILQQLKEFQILGLTNTNMKNAVYLTQYLSNWLFFNKYTNSKLLISNNEETQKINNLTTPSSTMNSNIVQTNNINPIISQQQLHQNQQSQQQQSLLQQQVSQQYQQSQQIAMNSIYSNEDNEDDNENNENFNLNINDDNIINSNNNHNIDSISNSN